MRRIQLLRFKLNFVIVTWVQTFELSHFTLFCVFALIVSMNTSMVSRSMDDSEELEDGETTGEIQANKVELNFNVSVSHICVL